MVAPVPNAIALDDLAKPLSVSDSETKRLDILASELNVLEVGKKRAEVFRFSLETWLQLVIIVVLVSFFIFLNSAVIDLIVIAHKQDNALIKDSIATRFPVTAGPVSTAAVPVKEDKEKQEQVRAALKNPTLQQYFDNVIKASTPPAQNPTPQTVNAVQEGSSWPPRVVSDSVVTSLITALLVQVGGVIAVIIGYLYRKPTSPNSPGS